MKRGSGSKQKGSSFERAICVKLSLWITNGERKDTLWRAAMSGGRATVHGTEVRQCGDVCAIAPEGHILTDFWLVECKHVHDLRMRGIFDDLKSRDSLRGYWLRAYADARRFGKTAMIIAKENQGPIIVCVPLSPVPDPFGRILNKLNSVNVERWGVSIYLFDELLQQKFKS